MASPVQPPDTVPPPIGGGTLNPVEIIDGCGCCGSGSGGGVLEPCVCETDCTIATRYLTITGTDDCDGTYPMTCVISDFGFGTIPSWIYEGPFGFDTLGFPCEGDATVPVWRFYCRPGVGIYTLIFEPPAEGSASIEAVEQQCDPFYARFEFGGIIGLRPCCDYTGLPIGVVTD